MKKIITISVCTFLLCSNLYSQCVYNISPPSGDTIYTLTPTLRGQNNCFNCNNVNCVCFGSYASPSIHIYVATDSLMINIVYTHIIYSFGTLVHTIPENVLLDTTTYWWNFSTYVSWLCFFKWPNCVGGPSGGSCTYLSIPFKFTIRLNPGGILPIDKEIPSQFSLSQNYPNPFNPKTKIRFALPKSSFANLVVYDALGSEVATLVNEHLNPGTYEVDWDGSGFASGIYYYKLTAGDYTETKKMVLMK